MRWSSGLRRSMELWRLSLLALVAGALVLMEQAGSARPNRCNVNLDPVGQYTDSARLITLTSRCSAANINWRKPNNGQIITFYRRHQSFTVCLRSWYAGGTIYRLRGSSMQLVAESNRTGILGCFESQCSHVSLLIEADNAIGPNLLKYRFQGTRDYRCPLCTETCHRHCMCKADYSFTGKLASSRYSDGIYTHYFKVAEFTRYNGEFTDYSLRELAKCNGAKKAGTSSTASLHSNALMNTSHAVTAAHVARSGAMMRVQSKCGLKIGKTYFVSAENYAKGQENKWLILCCASEDEAYSTSYLTDLVRKRECCRVTSRIDALNSTRLH